MISIARELLDILFATLWQGACIATIAAAALALTGRRLNAATRSVVLQCALVAMAIIPLVTTVPNIRPQRLTVGGRSVSGSIVGKVATNAPLARKILHRIDVTLDDRAVLLLTGLWIVGVLAFALRIGAGSLQLARLMRRSWRLPDRDSIPVFASPDIGVPLAVGFASAAVIVPNALAQTGDEFECIVLHELAHVRRHDVYTNACERLLHAFLFFNPAALLTLRMIALEREAACDDWAVMHSRDLDTYTRTLASFAVWGARNSSEAACGASGFGRATVTRIKRLQDARRNGATTLSHYALGGFTLVLAIIALILQSFAPAIAFAPQLPASQVAVATTSCHDSDVRYVGGPAPAPSSSVPNGLTTLVRVQVSATGKVTSTTLDKSSGNATFDRAVVIAAHKGEFAPAMRSCKPLSGSYIFKAQTDS